MRKTDLSPDRQKLLVPLDSHPGALALVPPPTPTHMQLPGLRGEIARAHEALGRIQASTASLPNPNLVTRTLDRREAVRSSQIEGTSSDIDDLLTFEATGSDEGLSPDVMVTLNYVKALEYGLEKVARDGVRALSIDMVKELHARLMEGVRGYGDTPGELRTRQSWIGGLRIYDAKFVPLPRTVSRSAWRTWCACSSTPRLRRISTKSRSSCAWPSCTRSSKRSIPSSTATAASAASYSPSCSPPKGTRPSTSPAF